jgi:Uma2 family endonuclease
MSAVPTKPLLTEEEYLKIERAASEKGDFYQGEMFAMAGASRYHNSIVANLVGALNGPLGDTSCRLFANDMRVRNEVTGLYNYPDAVIYCGEPRFLDRHDDVLLNPRVVIEVLSKSTESDDRGFKYSPSSRESMSI